MMTAYQDKLKRTVKLLISVAFYVATESSGALSRFRGRRTNARCVVLYYHSIRREDKTRFARQMDLLTRLTKPIRVDACGTLHHGVQYAAVTFDDGLQNVIDNALPELKKRDIPFTIFVIAEGFGRLLDWSDEFLQCYRSERILTEEQLRELPAPLVTIGSHTLTHSRLTAIDRNEAKLEIRESRLKLEKVINRAVTLFSFPFGAFNEELIELCREAEYERVFTTSPCLALSDPQEFVTGRVPVDPSDWSLEFRLKLLGAYRWLPFAIALKRKLRSNTLIARLVGRGQSLSKSATHETIRDKNS